MVIGAKGNGEQGATGEERRGDRGEKRGREKRRGTLRDSAQSGHALRGMCEKG